MEVLDLLLDERADRPNIDVRVFGSGAKMNPEQVEDVVPKVDQFDPDFCIFISPNPGAPGPAKARELLSEKDIPAIIIGDAPGKGKKDEMDEQGLGYIIVMSDPMIGAKREWLDPTEMANGVDVGVSSWRKPAPDTFPTLAKCGANYMNSQLAKLEAIDHGYEEAIMLDYEGHVSEGSGENIFIIEDRVLYTPSMDSSNLKGITRESIKQLANDLGYEVVEERISRERLYFADEVFFSGTAAEVTPIRSIDHKIIGAGKRGPISEELQKTFFDIVEGKKEDKFGWLDYV